MVLAKMVSKPLSVISIFPLFNGIKRVFNVLSIAMRLEDRTMPGSELREILLMVC